MFNITPTSHSSGGLRRSRSFAELPPWTPEFPLEYYLADTIPELEDDDDDDDDCMDPISPLSPTSPELPLTPTTPEDRSFASEWKSSGTPMRRPSPPMLDKMVSSALTVRKGSLPFIMVSQVRQSVFERGSQRRSPLRTRTRCLSTISEEAVAADVEQARLALSELDHDGDSKMSSPLETTVREDDWELEPPDYSKGLEREETETGISQGIPRSVHEQHVLQVQSSSSPPRPKSRRHSREIPRLHIPSPQQEQLKAAITHLSITLVPLVSVTSGRAHPDFPRSILQYHLLTHDQLDSLARWYHQTIDNNREKHMYPAIIERAWCFSNERRTSITESVDLVTKRRRFGGFIGLRGCESPVVEMGELEEEVEDVQERMEREWRTALRRAEEEERVLEKAWRGRF